MTLSPARLTAQCRQGPVLLLGNTLTKKNLSKVSCEVAAIWQNTNVLRYYSFTQGKIMAVLYPVTVAYSCKNPGIKRIEVFHKYLW